MTYDLLKGVIGAVGGVSTVVTSSPGRRLVACVADTEGGYSGTVVLEQLIGSGAWTIVETFPTKRAVVHTVSELGNQVARYRFRCVSLQSGSFGWALGEVPAEANCLITGSTGSVFVDLRYARTWVVTGGVGFNQSVKVNPSLGPVGAVHTIEFVAVVSNNGNSLTVSGADAGLGDYQFVTYPENLGAATAYTSATFLIPDTYLAFRLTRSAMQFILKDSNVTLNV